MSSTWLKIQDLKMSKIAFLAGRNPTQTKTCKLITREIESGQINIFETH